MTPRSPGIFVFVSTLTVIPHAIRPYAPDTSIFEAFIDGSLSRADKDVFAHGFPKGVCLLSEDFWDR